MYRGKQRLRQRLSFRYDRPVCLNLSGEEYNILSWLSILLQNRIFKISNDIAAEGKDYLLERFLPDYQKFDVIIGYRADDSYFSFANAFLNNAISLAQLEMAMYSVSSENRWF